MFQLWIYVHKNIGYIFWKFEGNTLLCLQEIELWMNPIFQFFVTFSQKFKFLNLCKIVFC